MPVIDKNMYEKLMDWCWDEENRPENQNILYVNSKDRDLTDATIRKMMFEIMKEDPHGEMYIAVFSAENFYRNMRGYYSHIAELYIHTTTENDYLLDIIEDYPPTCGWIVLVVENIELLSGKADEMKEMMESVFTFSARYPSIILVGEGEYETVFAGCEYALNEMTDGVAAKEDDDVVMVGCYNQEERPKREKLSYENADDHCLELNFYWDFLYRQLENRYFDYGVFKKLYRETLEYIKPRVTAEQMYRKDFRLVEYVGAMRKENNYNLDGCEPWEFDAAQDFSEGLYKAIINQFGYYDNVFLPGEDVEIGIAISEPSKDCGAIHISGAFYSTVKINTETVTSEMDRISNVILNTTYKGNRGSLLEYMQDKYVEEKGLESVPDEMIEVGNKLNSLMDGIKEAACRTVNKEHGS